MGQAFIDENVFQVLQSFRPFFGPRGSNCVMVLEHLRELMASEQAEKAFQALQILSSGNNYTMLEDQNELNTNPYVLFLILILLLLADYQKSVETYAEEDVSQGSSE
ncbi:MAG: Uncharacterized protein XD63_1393 [Thermoanaerobacterales bacterium 50_218]|nr:MAG: Uncharacterized protein XD63_1393 [Thermoanaerobacterales bacterium 50_218]HAA89755.1 hypothetical protein [Peptococcaceae bacterium]